MLGRSVSETAKDALVASESEELVEEYPKRVIVWETGGIAVRAMLLGTVNHVQDCQHQVVHTTSE